MYKILIADDEELEREALRFFINESSLDIDQVIECASGTEVIKRVMLDRPDIIVLDINMPGMNGLQALEKIKSPDYRFRAVFSTAYDYFEYAVEALRLGAVDFMVKPVKKEAFINVIMRAIDELDAEAEKEYRETKLLKTLDIMESKMVNDLVLGNMPEEVLYYLDLKNISTECGGNCFCIRIQSSLDKCGRQKLYQAVRKEFDYLDLTVMFSETNHMVTAVVFCREPDVLPGIFRKMEEFLASILRQQQIAFMMGSGIPFVDVSQIEESYEKARERVGDMVAQTERGEEGTEHDRDMPREVEGICSFIQENYQKRLTLDAIASEAGFSKYYVNRLFKQYMGTTVVDYLIRIRMKKAKELLRNETYSIKQISGMVGYSEPNYFTWTFKKMEGMSPLKFRYEQAEGIREEKGGE